MNNHPTFPRESLPKPLQLLINTYSKTTEAPDEYIAAAGLYLGSVLAGRYVSFNGVLLNNYYLLIGRTGTNKKTTAQSIATDLLDRIGCSNPELYAAHTMQDKSDEITLKSRWIESVTGFSVEGIQAHSLGGGKTTSLTLGEYGSLFQINKRQGQSNTIVELTSMYDCRTINVRNVKRVQDIENYSLSIFGASTSEWVTELGYQHNIAGGFLNRHLIITGTPVRTLPTPESLGEDKLNHIVHTFSLLLPQNLRSGVIDNQIIWTADAQTLIWDCLAQEAWNEYYSKRTEEMRSMYSDGLVDIAARELAHAVKCAGLKAFMEKRNTVTTEDLIFGAEFARWCVYGAVQHFGAVESVYASPPLQRVCNKVLVKIREHGGLTKKDLALKMGGKQEEVNKALRIMMAQEFLAEDLNEKINLGPLALNPQLEEKSKYFGKSNISEIVEKIKLKVDAEEVQQERLAIQEFGG